MNNTDRYNLAVFYGIKLHLKTITNSKIGISSEIRRVQKGEFKNKEDFEQMFLKKFGSLYNQYYEFKTKIEIIKRTQIQNEKYNLELINFIYNQILEILGILNKLKSVKINSDSFDSKDIQHYEMLLLEELLDKLNNLKKIKFKKVFNENWINLRMFGGMINPVNWIKKS